MLDPRPDLEHDSPLWNQVLEACERQPRLRGVLHGLRCGGATLARTETADGRPFLKLDYRPLLRFWDETKLLRTWLVPNYKPITRLFLRVAKAGPPRTFKQINLFTAPGKDG